MYYAAPMSQSTEKSFHSAENYNVALMRYLKFQSGMTNEQIVEKMREIVPSIRASEPTLSRFLNGQGNNIDFEKAFVLATGGDWEFFVRNGLPKSDFHHAVRAERGSGGGVEKARRVPAAGQRPRRAAAMG